METPGGGLRQKQRGRTGQERPPYGCVHWDGSPESLCTRTAKSHNQVIASTGMEHGSRCDGSCHPTQIQTHNAMNSSVVVTRSDRILYLAEIEPDCRDKVRVALFLWYWGAGLIIFNLPTEVGKVVLQYLPSWKNTFITDGFSYGDGMGYATSLSFPFYERPFQSGLQIARESGEAHDRVRRRMRGTALSRRLVRMCGAEEAALLCREISYDAPQLVQNRCF